MSRRASPDGLTTSTTTTSPSIAGRPSTGASSATECRSASISASTSSAGTAASGRGTSSVFQSGSSTFGCTATVAVNVKGDSADSGSSYS